MLQQVADRLEAQHWEEAAEVLVNLPGSHEQVTQQAAEQVTQQAAEQVTQQATTKQVTQQAAIEKAAAEQATIEKAAAEPAATTKTATEQAARKKAVSQQAATHTPLALQQLGGLHQPVGTLQRHTKGPTALRSIDPNSTITASRSKPAAQPTAHLATNTSAKKAIGTSATGGSAGLQTHTMPDTMPKKATNLPKPRKSS